MKIFDPEKLREARYEAHLSQLQLAEKIGVMRHHVTLWETGQRVPDTPHLSALTEALHLGNPWRLFREE